MDILSQCTERASDICACVYVPRRETLQPAHDRHRIVHDSLTCHDVLLSHSVSINMLRRNRSNSTCAQVLAFSSTKSTIDESYELYSTTKRIKLIDFETKITLYAGASCLPDAQRSIIQTHQHTNRIQFEPAVTAS
jgi:hypothetical protein